MYFERESHFVDAKEDLWMTRYSAFNLELFRRDNLRSEDHNTSQNITESLAPVYIYNALRQRAREFTIKIAQCVVEHCFKIVNLNIDNVCNI